MKLFMVLLSGCVCACIHFDRALQPGAIDVKPMEIKEESYDAIKDSIKINRRLFYNRSSSKKSVDAGKAALADFWINAICNELFDKWKNTPWDFNGTATEPNKGSIACGYFVTTVLCDMDLKIDRIRLAVCASSIMMKNLVPNQKLKNLSYLGYSEFNDSLTKSGKCVYIIGLDYHTGFIINDGTENWFIPII